MQFPTVLEGQRAQLLPLEPEHAVGLYECGKAVEIWTYLPVKVDTLAAMQEFVHDALKAKQLGLEYPFVVFDKNSNKIAGTTRFLHISMPDRNLEIGWTWYTPDVWRTRVNTECKFLLLKSCFEDMKTVSVQFKTDMRNTRSNIAIARLGAKKEGELRQDRILYDGFKRTSNVYSIIDAEWPEVKSKLENHLKRS